MEQTLENKILDILNDKIVGMGKMFAVEALATFFKQELEQERRKAFEAAREGKYAESIFGNVKWKAKYWTFEDYESYLASL